MLYRVITKCSKWCGIISCIIKFQNCFTFLVPVYPVCPGKEAIMWVCFSNENNKRNSTDAWQTRHGQSYTYISTNDHRNRTRCNAKPDCIPPAYPLAAGQLTGLPMPCTLLALPVICRHLPNVMRTQFCEQDLSLAHKIGCHSNIPRRIGKLTSAHSSTAIVLPTLQIWRGSVSQMTR